MSRGATKLRDVRSLADSRAVVEWDLPVAELPGLPSGWAGSSGMAHARVRFGHEQGYVSAHVVLDAKVQALCQRCLQPVTVPLTVESPVLLVDSEQQAEQAPPEWETLLAPDGRVDLPALLAEELLLALPIVPLHGAGESCVAPQAEAAAPPAEPGTSRPFADLRALLGRGDSSR